MVPVIGISIKGPRVSFPERGEMPTRIDTGYDGFILISESLYKKLKLRLSEIPRELWATGRTVTGEFFILKRASIIVHIPKAKLEMEGHVETFKENTENLVGLRFLENLKTFLDGPKKEVCLFVESNST